MKKQAGFKLHVTSMVSVGYWLLQVCSIATNTNGTLGRSFIIILFSIIDASLFFAVHFVLTFEKLVKKAAIQDHISISF